MIWVLALLWMFGAVAVGFPLASLVLTRENRLSALLLYALAGGYVMEGLLLIALWGYMRLELALYVTLCTALITSVVLWRKFRARFVYSHWGMTKLQTTFLLVLIPLCSFLGYRLFTLGYQGLTPEDLFCHSAIVGWIARIPYPPTNPLEPSDPLRYRFGFHALAGALSSSSGALPTESSSVAMALVMPLMPVALVGASLRLFGSATPGLVATALGLFGGSLSYWHNFLRTLLFAEPFDQTDGLGGVLWNGNALDMVVVSAGMAAGFILFFAALWLCYEALFERRSAGFLVAVASLAYLGVVNEVYFVALACGLTAVGAFRAYHSLNEGASKPWRPLLEPLAMCLVALVLVSWRGGLAGGIGLFDSGPGSMKLVPNFDHFGSVVAPPRYNPPLWVPISSLLFQVDSDFYVLGIPLLLLCAWRARSAFAATAVFASLATFFPWALVYPRDFPAETYRFGHVAMVLYVTAVPFCLAGTWKWRGSGAWPTSRRLITVLLLALVVTPHVAREATLMSNPPQPTDAVPGSPDYQAAEFLRQSTDTWRVLVPLEKPDGDWVEMYTLDSNVPGVAMRNLLALSGHSIPIGHQVYWNPQRYIPYYRQASSTFDRESLKTLDVDWVYVLPASMTAQQRESLRSAQEAGILRLEKSFGETRTSGERLLFRVGGGTSR